MSSVGRCAHPAAGPSYATPYPSGRNVQGTAGQTTKPWSEVGETSSYTGRKTRSGREALPGLKHCFVRWCKAADVLGSSACQGAARAESPMTDWRRSHCIRTINCHQCMTVAETTLYIAKNRETCVRLTADL